MSKFEAVVSGHNQPRRITVYAKDMTEAIAKVKARLAMMGIEVGDGRVSMKIRYMD